MSGMSHVEPKFRGMRRNPQSSVKMEEKRLQKLLDFIDNRMQDQRSKLRRQIEDTQQSADDMEERKHKATLQLLKNYFEVTSGRVPPKPDNKINRIHEERMTGVLSEPSLAIVPELDPDVLAKPRSMYDRLTRTLDTSRLPLIAPKNRNLISQSQSLPASMPSSTRSDRSDESSTPQMIATPHGTPSSTPSDSTEDSTWSSDVKKPKPLNIEAKNGYRYHQKGKEGSSINNQRAFSQQRNGHVANNTQSNDTYSSYDNLNGHIYQKGSLKPASRVSLYEESEPPTPRLGDVVSSKYGLTRHSSLKRPMGRQSTMAMSTASLSELQPTRKQQAANKLKHALKGTVRVPR